MKPDRDTKDMIRTAADEKAAALGMRFDGERAQFAAGWMEENLCLYEGEYAGQQLRLMPYQREFVSRLFGWVQWSGERKEWIRRFTSASLWCSKKSGKSPTLAAIGLYLTCGDGEQGQKVYMAAKNGDQAKIAQRHAFAMVEQSPALRADCKLNRSTLQVTHVPTRSIMMILTGDDSRGAKAKEGLNGSVLIDECFVAGTRVITTDGEKPIEQVYTGDEVYCATGIGTVLGRSSRQTTELYRVEFADGTSLTCTGSHRIFTDSGWVAASALDIGAVAYGPEELYRLWEEFRPVAEDVPERGHRGDGGADVGSAAVLLDILLQETDEPDAQPGTRGEGEQATAGDRAQAVGAGRERTPAHPAAVGTLGRTGGGLAARIHRARRSGPGARVAHALQNRHRQPGPDDRGRGGRVLARADGTEGARRAEDGPPERTRVVGVSRIECDGAVTVFNLHVSGHPSYFANGRLVHNCHVFDREMHERTSRAGISRREPLNLAVSTAGDDPSSYGFERCQYGRQVNEGQREDPHFLHVEYAGPEGATEADIDANLEEYGRAANPAWGHIVKASEFRADWQRSKGNPREVARFKQYRLNVWVGSTNPWLDVAGWEKGRRDYDAESLRGRPCFVGLDLSRTRDMTSAVFLFPWDEDGAEVLRVWPLFWLPEATAKARDHLFPFRSWARGGFVTPTPGDVVDYKVVEEELCSFAEEHALQVRGLYFDQHYAEEITQRVAERLGCERTAVSQSLMTLSPLAKEFERRVSTGLIRHANNAVMSWQVGHVEVWADRNQNVRPVKPSPLSGKCIDGVMAALDAMAGVVNAVPPSVYESRGLEGVGEAEPEEKSLATAVGEDAGVWKPYEDPWGDDD